MYFILISVGDSLPLYNTKRETLCRIWAERRRGGGGEKGGKGGISVQCHPWHAWEEGKSTRKR